MKRLSAVSVMMLLAASCTAQWTNPPLISTPGGYTNPPAFAPSAFYIHKTNQFGGDVSGTYSNITVLKIGNLTAADLASNNAAGVQTDLNSHKTNMASHADLLSLYSTNGHLHNHASLTNLNGDVSYQHISTGRVALIDSALQPAATNGLASTGYVAAALGGYLPTSTVYVAAESDPGWTAASSSVAYATSLASYLPLAGGTMSGVITMGAYTVDGQRFGNDAGYKASGNGWYAFGGSAGQGATGDSWLAVGMVAGSMTLGNNWTAIGPYSGKSAAHTNSMAIGRFAGYGARGNNRMYLDVYGANPNYGFDGMATNDTIFMDSDGKLFLGGGGARAENPSAGGVLRGTWDIGAPTGSGAGLTNLSGAAIAAAIHTQAWGTITGTPTTVSGYGITDGMTTTGGASGTNLTGSVFSSGKLTTLGSAFTPAGTTAVQGVVIAMGALTNIPAVITPTTLAVVNGTATVENVHYYSLDGLTTNVTVVIGNSMTNTAQARSFWLDWTNTTYSITFPTASFSNITANTATTNGAYSSFWHAGKGQTIFRGGWR